jgi:DNA recombination protein RmuC
VTAVLIMAVILLLAAVAACVWLAAERRGLRSEQSRLQGELAAAQQQIDAGKAELHELAGRIEQMRGQLAQAERDLAVAAERQQSLQREMEAAREQAVQNEARLKVQFTDLLKHADERFRGAASEALSQSARQFLELAGQRFKVEQTEADKQLAARQHAIEGLVKPIHEKLESYNKALTEIEKARNESYASLREQLGMVAKSHEQLGAATRSLATALRRPEVRGRWGEVHLRKVAELTGMVDHCDFQQQVTTTGDESLRPDMLIHLPGGREIVIDAKTPIDAFLDACEAAEETIRQAKLDQHVRQIEQKVDALGSKRYQDHFKSADFVVLFIPGESFLHPAVTRKPTLIESAMERGVVIATPSTLFALLKAVEKGWREQKLADNARRIFEEGKELHKRLCVALGHLESMRESLHKTCETFNKFVSSINRNVITQATRFEELGADSLKELPEEVRAVDTQLGQVRELQHGDEAGPVGDAVQLKLPEAK